MSVIPFGKYILLRWGPPVDENGVMKGYVVGVVKTTGNQLAPDKPKLETKLKTNQFEYLFEDLDHTTDYQVGVAGETGCGVGPAVYLSALTVSNVGKHSQSSCVCEVTAFSKICHCQPGGPGFNSRPRELWATFFHHAVRGQGR